MRKTKRHGFATFQTGVALAIIGMLGTSSDAFAYKFETSPEWNLNLDTSVQYTAGWRAQNRDDRIGNDPLHAASNYKFDKGDMVTNRLQALVEFQGAYKDNTGFRVTGSLWKDFAYDNEVKSNPAFMGAITPYPSGQYSDYTKKYHLQGAELLDAFVFKNTTIGDKPVYLKAGRLTQFWGNGLFFGFSNIAYSQSPIDFIKGFTQPGSEVKELFLPRQQLLGTVELSPELSISGQYFLEFEGNRYPESGTYLAPADISYRGPVSFPGIGPLAIERKPKDNNDNFGVKVAWSPEWAQGDLGFYYRQFDDVNPWILIDASGANLSYAEKTKLYGLSYERSFGAISTGFEFSYREDTGLNSVAGINQNGENFPKGAKGDLYNIIANTFVQLGDTALYDTGILLAELSYTELLDVDASTEAVYHGVGRGTCVNGRKEDGCGTDRALAVAMLFEPQWLQVFPGWDLSSPMSLTYGINGNPAYSAGGFYAEGAAIYSLGIKGTYQGKHSVSLAYNGYHWNPGPTTTNAFGLEQYASSNGPKALNDKGWIQLTVKTSF
ncbi:DUF1302 family protein [Limnobacter sp. UBA7229]|uniref:DUF1302 domain-containing protein n=1 Tax=Limnobacter sp. UBA7229 TaxID=1946762 RepID=UPI0025B8C523|nr:DUF1302 family protein [Limnobacter sp. UBA7229]|tara:strand:+ start:20721 stop:22373 length:1653 start_codon:yes stop_codon:yes gene_type:complete